MRFLMSQTRTSYGILFHQRLCSSLALEKVTVGRISAEEQTDSMRGPTGDEILKTLPPDLRVSSKTAQAYLDVRRKILTGEYAAHQVLVPRQIEEAHHINNTTTQMLLMRLANEGLVKVLPIKERAW